VLVGSPLVHELAYMLDEDLRKLFRVKAEFGWRVRWDDDVVPGYAGFSSARCRASGCDISTPPRWRESSSTARA